ncbi:MAG: exo-alpha-sialidase [Bryobacterales bacterium]|nr:exo-alpha-sialidase [Bryobacterales bacterium]
MRLPILLLLASALYAQSYEFVYEKAPFASCHASTLLEAKNGDILSAWFGGSREGAKDVAIWMSRRTADGWSAPIEMARHDDTPTWNPVLFRTLDGVTWLYYKFGTSPREWTGAYRFSEDDGRTWSEPRAMPAGLLGPIKNKPISLPDGTVLSGTSVESYQSWTSYAEISTDRARTWSRSGPVAHPTQPFGLIQPTLVPIPGGVRMFMRSRNIGRICASESFDGGETWSPAWETELPNPNSGIDAVALADGRLVMIYNDTEKGRSPLNLAVSHDYGRTWKRFLDLETDPGEYSYPAIIQGSDGNLRMVYTWKRERVRYVDVPLTSIP